MPEVPTIDPWQRGNHTTRKSALYEELQDIEDMAEKSI
jgi:hypothetical protein